MVESRPPGDISRVFVGRQPEMAELTDALDGAMAGRLTWGASTILGSFISSRVGPLRRWMFYESFYAQCRLPEV